ncbi:LytR C-terminal domain-containing protein [Gulosibacter sp. ACHW.36C]|uniref:LytR C-terminal domain-containing protein n=1 Tax=Gulosibacter sediminis TaxID=1729695 RepID=A0ABY4MYP2_9MICO|nr:LytR C-terminal domain-containing protein [Gulosibacter sediminis]UQN15555.1 LytR C-terminal domain-containing protein [Gulosibacter sediminis]
MKYPKDRFDDFPRTLKRRGAHRAPRTWASKFMSWIVAIVAFVLLVGIGVGVMWAIDNQVQFTADMGGQEETTSPTESSSAGPTPTPTETGPSATVDASLSVTVLNGIGTPGLATAGSEAMTSGGWTVGTVADADSFDYQTTSIVVASEDQRGAALGAQETLGFGEISVDPNIAAEGTLVVILGSDAGDALL